MAPVLYRLDESGEAEDVLYFCSSGCRDAESAGSNYVAGDNGDWIDGTVCDHCAVPLVA